MLSTTIDFVADNGLMLIAGASVILLIGVIAACFMSSLIHKQRVCEFTLIAFFVWLLLALIPLPRLTIDHRMNLEPSSRSVANRTIPPDDTHTHDEKPFAAESSSANPPTLRSASLPVLPEIVLDLPESSAQFRPMRNESAERATGLLINWPSTDRLLCVMVLAGFGLSCIWLLIGQLAVQLTVLRARLPAASLLETYESISFSCSPNKPRLLVSDGGRAFACGLRRPTIVIPALIADRSPQKDIRNLLLHELSHVQQRDMWGRILFNLAFPFLYFHPFYWILRRGNDLAAELIADECASSKSTRIAYAESMVRVAKHLHKRSIPFAVANVIGAGSYFARRIKYLISGSKHSATSLPILSRSLMASAIPVLAAFVAGICGVTDERFDQASEIRKAIEQPEASRVSLRKSEVTFPAETIAYFSIDSSFARNAWDGALLAGLTDHQADETVWSMLQSETTKRLEGQLERFLVSRQDLFEIASGELAIGIIPEGDGFSSLLMVETAGKEDAVDKLLGKLDSELFPKNKATRIRSINGVSYFVFSALPHLQSSIPELESKRVAKRDELARARENRLWIAKALNNKVEQSEIVGWFRLHQKESFRDDHQPMSRWAEYQRSIEQLEFQRLNLIDRYSSKHSHVTTVQAQINHMKNLLQTELTNELRRAKDELLARTRKLEQDVRKLNMQYESRMRQTVKIAPRDMCLLVQPGRLLFSDEPSVIESVITGHRPLAEDPAFAEIKRSCRTQVLERDGASFQWFVRPLELIRWYGFEADEPNLYNMAKIFARQGFDAVKGFGGLAKPSKRNGLKIESMVYAPNLLDDVGQSNLIKSARILNFPASERTPGKHVPSGLHGVLQFNWNSREALEQIGSLVEATSGTEGSWKRTLDSLHQDPHGPQVDVRKLFDQLNERVSLYTHVAETDAIAVANHWMLTFEIDGDEALVRESVRRLVMPRAMAADEIAPLEIWSIGPPQDDELAADLDDLDDIGPDPLAPTEAKDGILYSVCVTDQKLVFASHPAFIKAMLVPSKDRRPLTETRDFKRVARRLYNSAGGPVSGKWFVQTGFGPLGVVVKTERNGWRISGLVVPKK